MSVFHNNALIGAGAGTGAAAAAEYVISKSLRFNSGDSAYLSRTPSSSGNRRTFTFSCWVKRSKPVPSGSGQELFRAGDSALSAMNFAPSDGPVDSLSFKADQGGVSPGSATNAVFRDFSAWMHVVYSIDTTQATAADRVRVYVNGVEQTWHTTNYPSQNQELKFNQSGQPHYIGGTEYFDGYMADIQFVDGQALAPTDFGETRSSDGVWVPKEYTGSYGPKVNQTQNWTALGTGDSYSPYRWEETFDGDSSTYGAIPPNGQAALVDFSSLSGGGISYTSSVVVTYNRNTNAPDVTVNGSAIGATADGTERTYTLSGSGTLTSVGTQTRTAGGSGDCGIKKIVVDGAELVDSGITLSHNGFHLNFSDSSTNEALGFDSAPTIPDADPKKGFDVVTYSGNGGTQNIGGLNFEPGLVWIKSRTSTNGHNIYDTVRGANKYLSSHLTTAEGTSTNELNTFNPDGFNLGSAAGVNGSGKNYVAWAWQAGGPAVANTAGTITTEVSANTDYGFSIIKWTGVNNASPQTVGHGLTNQTPKFFIVKNLSSSQDWAVYHASLGNTKYLTLNGTSAAGTSSAYWNDTSPTSTLIHLNNNDSVQRLNDDFVLYAWSEVSGYSKFGSYTGTGSAGLKITTGFKPAFVLIRNTAGGDWFIFDNQRDSTNPVYARLYPNLSSSEDTGTANGINFLDDGFDIPTTHAGLNASSTFYYAAFADRPGNNWDVNNIVTNEGLTTSKTQFDVLTYTGNGGTQKLGGPVFSSSADSGLTHADGVTGMFDGSLSTRGGVSSTDNSYKTLTDGVSISASTGIRIYWNGVGAGQRYIRINGTTELDDGSAALTPGWSTQSSFSGTINKIEVKTASSGSWSLAAVEVDGTILIDGTGPGLSFQPDFVWLKSLTAADSHSLFDSVRGAPKGFHSNTSGAEFDDSSTLTAFNSDGFTLAGHAVTNANNQNYAAWCWKAGGTAASNTDGSITSSVSAGDGFSVVTWTGTATAGTIGHGLNGKVPQFIITKRRDSSGDWYSQHASLGATHRIQLNSSSAATSGTSLWNSTGPTGSVFSVGADNEVNASGGTFVAYCFANVPGRQRVGSYPGSGSAVTVITGFKPRFILVRSTSNARDWLLWDSERGASGGAAVPNLSNTPYSDSTYNGITFNADGFTIMTGGSTPNMSASGETYIYLAIGDDEIGSDEDCLVDVPNAVTADADATDTTGGYQRGNYATLNPAAPHGLTLSNGNLDGSGSVIQGHAPSTIFASSGKFYCEFTLTTYQGDTGVGVAASIANPGEDWIGEQAYTVGYLADGRVFQSGSSTSYSSYAAGDVIGAAFDVATGKVWFHKNGVYLNSGDPAAGTGQVKTISGGYSLGFTFRSVGGAGSFNFGQQRFKYPMPTGFSSLNTTALPAATIADGSAQFNTQLWTGNGSDNRTVTGYGFQPDFAWIKVRNQSYNHNLQDAVQGTGSYLSSNTTTAATTEDRHVKSFDSDGFTLGVGGFVNSNNDTYVGWAWNAGANSNKTYTVKVVSDSGNKYRFDDFGTSAVTLDLEEGSTYIFDQSDSSNAGHPIRFGTSANGTDYTTGVTHTGTPGSAGAKTTLVLGTGVATLYYSCANHSGMGGQINTNSTAGASNFDGSLQSTVKSNPEAGFSVVTYTGVGAARTIGHGLNAAPEMIITKARNQGSYDWAVYHSALGATKHLRLNQTSAVETSSYAWNDTAPTSSVFSVANASFSGDPYNYVAYCISPVAGYSAVGSYIGSGDTNGPFVYTGFKPAFILLKTSTRSGDQWVIHDTSRDTYNAADAYLLPNTNGAEGTISGGIDILSNGFKVRNGSGSYGGSGDTYIWYAVAENPFSANGGLAR